MNGKLALLCDADEPCHISSEDSMFPYPNQFCHPPFPRGGCTQRYDSAIVVLGDMEVFMINVVIGPHANTAIVGTGQNPVGGLLTANGVFTGVNVTFQGGGALYGAGVSVGKRFACGGCRGFCGFLDNGYRLSKPRLARGSNCQPQHARGARLAGPSVCQQHPSVQQDCAATRNVPGDADGGALKCCVCDGEGCPACCVKYGQVPRSNINESGSMIPCGHL